MSMSPATKHFIRHYVEMVIAMFVGMAVLGFPVGWAMDRVGADSDAFMFLEMATTMTVGMVAWMVYRGHGWRANAEMSAAMFVPTFAVIGALSAELLTDLGALMVIEHVVMLLAMFGAMLARPAEYTHQHAQVTA
jgi:flagellar biosynthetic protein FliP